MFATAMIDVLFDDNMNVLLMYMHKLYVDDDWDDHMMIGMIIWWSYDLYIYWYICDIGLFLFLLYTIQILNTLCRFGEICIQCPIFAQNTFSER